MQVGGGRALAWRRTRETVVVWKGSSGRWEGKRDEGGR